MSFSEEMYNKIKNSDHLLRRKKKLGEISTHFDKNTNDKRHNGKYIADYIRYLTHVFE